MQGPNERTWTISLGLLVASVVSLIHRLTMDSLSGLRSNRCVALTNAAELTCPELSTTAC